MDFDIKRILFTDEKNFKLEIAKNHQNNCVYGQQKRDIHPSQLYYERYRFSRKIMVLAGVSWQEKRNIYFIDTRGAKVDSEKLHLVIRWQSSPELQKTLS